MTYRRTLKYTYKKIKPLDAVRYWKLSPVTNYETREKQCLRDRLCLGPHAKGMGKAPALSALLDGAISTLCSSLPVFLKPV